MSKSMHPIEPSEQMKIIQLLNEKKSDSQKVEWLYGGEKVDREAYLLGKPIDKLITEKEKEEAKKQIKFTSTIDLVNKIKDDPLFEIKKQEIEAKKRLLENPLKMKKIKEMISRGRQESPDRHKKRKSLDSDDDDRRYEKQKRKLSQTDDDYGFRETSKEAHHMGYKSEISREKCKEIENYKKKIEDLKKLRDTKVDTSRDGSTKYNVKKLTDEEKRLKLQQMTENAKWRHNTRSQNVSKYKYDEKKEEDDEKEKKHESKSVFNSMIRDAYVSTEDRIKRNIKNIQRVESAYDSNFARR